MCRACDDEFREDTVKQLREEHSGSSVMRLKERFMGLLETAVSGTRIGVLANEPSDERARRPHKGGA